MTCRLFIDEVGNDDINHPDERYLSLIAHASHHGTKAKYTGTEMSANFGSKIYKILEDKKYRRNPKTLRIEGWGQKWLP